MSREHRMRWRLRQTVRRLPVGYWGGYLWVQWQDPDDAARWLPYALPEGAQPDVVAPTRPKVTRRLSAAYDARLVQLRRAERDALRRLEEGDPPSE